MFKTVPGLANKVCGQSPGVILEAKAPLPTGSPRSLSNSTASAGCWPRLLVPRDPWSLMPLTDKLDRQWALCRLNMSLFRREKENKVPPTEQMVQKWNRTKRHDFQLAAWYGRQDSALPALPARTTATITRAANTYPAFTKC